MNKWNIIEFLIVIMLVLFIFMLFFTVRIQLEQTQIGDIECEHEFTTTSRYNFFTNKYKVVSKCIKCGKEI